MTNRPIKISDNCWKHTYKNGDCIYTKTSDPDSDFHREDGPAIEYVNGSKEWYFHGKRHRKDGPACEYGNGDKVWLINGKHHREDGPAIEHADGRKYWYYHGKRINVNSQQEFEIYLKNLIFI